MSFGKEIRENEFVLRPDVTFVNHGSYGTAPKEVLEARLSFIKEQEDDPNEWFRTYSHDYYKAAAATAARFIGADETNIVFVDNATSGVNHVVKSLQWSADDAILVTSYTYKAIQYTCKSATENTDAKVVNLDITKSFSSKNDIVEQLDLCLQNNSHIKLAVLDYISSPTATLFPVADLIKVCKSRNVLVLIDGAHAIGQVQLNLEELGQLGMDFFTGNVHKWAYSCRGCAVLWVHPRHHNVIRPLITSFQHIYSPDDFRSRFVRNGTGDRSNFYTAKHGIEFHERHGGVEGILAYTTKLADEAVEHLVSVWGTHKYPLPRDMEAPNMRLVRLPHLGKFPPPADAVNAPFGDMPALAAALRQRFNIAAYVTCIGGELWTRISVNIYNTIEDYQKFSQAILDLAKEN